MEENVISNGRIITRNDFADNWKENNPILLKGELALEIDTLRMKFGDGLNPYNNLRYVDKTYSDMMSYYEKDEALDTFAQSLKNTKSGQPCEIVSDVGSRFEVTINGKTIQTGTGIPSPSNIRPIHGIGTPNNLFDHRTFVTHSDGFIKINPNSIVFTNPTASGSVEITPYVGWVEGQTYTVSFDYNATLPFNMDLYPDKYPNIDNITAGNVTGYSTTFKVPERFVADKGVFRFYINGAGTGTITISNLKLNYGSSVNNSILPDTFYSPIRVNGQYKNMGTTLKFAKELFDGDKLSIKQSQFDRRYTVTGEEAWEIDETDGNSFKVFKLGRFNIKPTKSENISLVSSNYYPSVSINDVTRTNFISGICSQGEELIILDPKYQDLESWKNHLMELRENSNPLVIHYQSGSYDGTNGLWLTEIVKNTTKIVLNGTETYYVSPDSVVSNGSKRLYMIINNDNSINNTAICNQLESTYDSDTTYYNAGQLVGNKISANGNTAIYLRINNVDTIDKMNAKIKQLYDAGTPIEVVYKLRQPEVYTYNYSPLFYSLYGVNKIWAEGNVTCYYSDSINSKFEDVDIDNSKIYSDSYTQKITDDIVTINNVSIGEPLEIKIEGVTTQVGGKFPSPTNVRNVYGLGNGTNLMPNLHASNLLYMQTVNGISFTTMPDGTMTLDGTATSSFKYDISSNIYLEKGIYTLDIGDDYNNTQTNPGIYLYKSGTNSPVTNGKAYFQNKRNSFILSDSGYYYVGFFIDNGNTFSKGSYTFYPSLYKGNVKQQYRPYLKSAKYDIPILVKNSINKVNRITSVYNYSSIPVLEEFFKDDIVKLKKSKFDKKIVFTGNENWTNFSTNTSGINRMGLPGYILDIVTNSTNTAKQRIKSNYYISGAASDNHSKIKCVSIDAGSNILIYDSKYNDAEAWKNHLVELYESGNPLTLWYRSKEYDGTNGLWVNEVTKNYRKLEFTGDEGWTDTSISSSNSKKRMILSIPEAKPVGNNVDVADLICNQYKIDSLLNLYIDDNTKHIALSDNGTLSIYDSTYTTVATWKSHLKELYNAGNPLTIVYRLKNTENYFVEPNIIRTVDINNVITSENTITVNTIGKASILSKHIQVLKDRIVELENRIGVDENDPDIVGIQIDLKNKKFTRLAGAVGKNAGEDFDIYPMYGGRKRCNVADNLTINAWYGDAGYKDDGTNGQVMVYQPKFYYKVVPLEMDKQTNGLGYHLRKANYYISYKPKSGFKLHPAFYNESGNEVEYIFIGAYKGCIYDVSASKYLTLDEQVADFTASTGDKLSSIANVKPCSGVTQNLTRVNLEQLAKNRGSGWHLNTAKIIMAQAMLAMIEYGECNIQRHLGNSFVSITDQSAYNCSCNTGSTASLGNKSGMATQTTSIINNVTTNYTDNGKLSVSYRGVEDPWGNIWEHTFDSSIWGNGKLKGGVPYVCTDFNYVESKKDGNYESVGFTIANSNGYISALGYGNEKYDWFFMGSEVSGNSALPVSDYQLATANLNGYRVSLFGGMWSNALFCGVFYWHLNNGVGDRYRAIGGRVTAYSI